VDRYHSRASCAQGTGLAKCQSWGGREDRSVSLQKIGIVKVAGGDIQIPLTRIIGDRKLSIELPIDGGTVAVQVELNAGDLVVRVSPAKLDSIVPLGQGSLFADEESDF